MLEPIWAIVVFVVVPLAFAFVADRHRHRRAREICICAAVLTTDGRIIRGHRHSDCFRACQDRKLAPQRTATAQGFMTSRNRFVGRAEAAALQRRAKIASVDPHLGYRFYPSMLFSEDLYVD